MIYFVEAVGTDLLKIGFTDRDVECRLKELQTGCPHKLRVLATYDGGVAEEAALHTVFSHLRTTGEWFRMDDEVRWLVSYVRRAFPTLVDFETRLRALEDSRIKAETPGQVYDSRDVGIDAHTLQMQLCDLYDQIDKIWNAIGRMNGWPNGIQRPDDTLAVIPRVGVARDVADCRM